MEWVGDEKRIQALFSELSLEDHSCSPRFEQLWMRAASAAPVPTKSRARAVALIIAVVLVAAAYVLATRPWNRSSQPEHAIIVTPQAIPAPAATPATEPEKLVAAERKSFTIRRYKKPLRQRQTERIAASVVAKLSSWQSPTNVFLEWPAVSVLSSLPQLNQSARDLEQFLPKNNQATKESKQ